MDEDDGIVTGVLAGIKMTRHSSNFRPVLGVGDCVVRLPDGREVAAIMDLPPLKHWWMVRTLEIGSKVRLKLGTVLEPIRLIEILEPDPERESGG